MCRWVCIIKHTVNAEPVYNVALPTDFFCLFQSTLYETGFLAEQGEQQRTEQPTGLLPVAEINFECMSIPQEQTKTATNHP